MDAVCEAHGEHKAVAAAEHRSGDRSFLGDGHAVEVAATTEGARDVRKAGQEDGAHELFEALDVRQRRVPEAAPRSVGLDSLVIDGLSVLHHIVSGKVSLLVGWGFKIEALHPLTRDGRAL